MRSRRCALCRQTRRQGPSHVCLIAKRRLASRIPPISVVRQSARSSARGNPSLRPQRPVGSSCSEGYVRVGGGYAHLPWLGNEPDSVGDALDDGHFRSICGRLPRRSNSNLRLCARVGAWACSKLGNQAQNDRLTVDFRVGSSLLGRSLAHNLHSRIEIDPRSFCAAIPNSVGPLFQLAVRIIMAVPSLRPVKSKVYFIGRAHQLIRKAGPAA